ncbi:type I polyketide synthase, partial [Rhodoferax antarcticus]|uniref:type I polyketide synthase n=1 Tax=Rhodoferax antarcticus TaxID=81479 RepID=UPI002225AEC9
MTRSAIAVVGLAFRFPGDFADEQTFWQALKEGRDLVTAIDPGRWATDRLKHPKRSEPGRAKTFAAGVLSRIDEFDAEFFGISPREAAWLDPQQRLLLELAWESMENGGIAPSTLAGSDCSVFVGISGVDYGMRAMDDLSSMTAHSMTGNTLSVAANRLSYVFDLHGPSMAVDTACSSSLVALHHACNSLRMGESSMALVGGVNLLLHPYPFIGFTKASMLSSTGRCRAFDAAADGYVRAEGGAVFLLKPLDKALADGDVVHAVILATGANADGNRKTGLTIPSCRGQVELMRSVLLRSGLCADDIDYIEAHGTGTAVGDPIEAAAIGEVYGRPRSNGLPLPVGSVKTNLGHLEPASGMAGLAKAILTLKNRALAPSLHLVKPNPRIDFIGLNIEVVTSYRPLAESHQKKMVVGVNSFGFGGANAHVLLQEFRPQTAASLQPASLAAPLFLSAKTPKALKELAGRYAETLKQRSYAQYDIAYGAAFRRDRLKKRLVLKAGAAADMAAALGAFALGQRISEMVVEDALVQPGGVAFIYSGNGSQWLGMGRQLMLESVRFAELISGLDEPILARAGFSILEELEASAETSQLADTAVAQPLLFAIQVALTSMLRESGVQAQAVAGHSVGEVAAAWAAGALSLDQAIEVICARSAAQAKTGGTGRMAAAGISQEAAQAILKDEKLDTIEVAGINSPGNITLSGPLADLERFGLVLATRSIFFRLLDLDYAFHSCAMDPIKSDLIAQLAPLAPVCGDSVFVSTVTGEALTGTALDADYWWRNVRQPVQFAKAIAALADIGCRVFVEIGPHAILQRYISESLSAKDISGRVLTSLRHDDDSLARFEETVLRIHLLAEPLQLNCFFPIAGQPVLLPNYPWQRERHWHPRTSEANGEFDKLRIHPLLGWPLNGSDVAWENTLDPDTCTWLADHKVAGAMVLPGAAYVEMALAAARERFGGNHQEIEELDILAPIVFDGEHARTLRFELNSRDGGFQIRSRQRLSMDDWMLNAIGRLLGCPAVMLPPSTNHTAQAVGNVTVIDHDTHYRLTAALGLDYGPMFQGFELAQLQGQTLWANLALPQAVQDASDEYILHPALLDICFQSLVDFFQETIESGNGVPFLPVKVGRLRVFADAPIVQFRTYFKRRGLRTVLADFELLDATGQVVVALEGCRLRAASLQRKKPSEPTCWLSVPHLMPRPNDQLQTVLPSIPDLSNHLRARFLQAPSAPDRSTYFKDAQRIRLDRAKPRSEPVVGRARPVARDFYCKYLL